MAARNSAVKLVIAVLIISSKSVFAGAQSFTFGGSFNLRIPADPCQSKGSMNDAVVEVPNHLTIYDLDVAVDITHSKDFDLQIFLQSPSGTRICLNAYTGLNDYFNGANYTGTIFDDHAQTPIEDATAPFAGRFKPKAGYFLSAFNGSDAFGQWRLQIDDACYADTGTLNSFQLTIAIPELSTIVLLVFGSVLARTRKKRNLMYVEKLCGKIRNSRR
jgi:subtilisin-like proprotein convertase family protein